MDGGQILGGRDMTRIKKPRAGRPGARKRFDGCRHQNTPTTAICQEDISTFRGINKRPTDTITWQKALKDIASDKYKGKIENVREVLQRFGADSPEYRKIKIQLPAVTFGGTFSPTRTKGNIVSSTGFIIPDLDHLNESTELIFNLLTQDPNVGFVFRSPSGEGIKAGIRAQNIKNDSDYKRLYFAVERYFKEVYGIEIDPACKDISRLTFVSYDPALWVNAEPQYFDIKAWEKSLPVKPQPVKTDFTHTAGKEKYARKVLESCCEEIRQSLPGNQHHTRLKAARLIGGYLQYISESEALAALEQAVIASGAKGIAPAMKTVRDGLEYGKLSPIIIPDIESAQAHSGSHTTLSMADLREYIDLCVVPGQKITVDEICRGLACYKRNERKILYKNITRLCSEGILKKDDYKHGGYRRAIGIEPYNLGGAISEDDLIFNISLPLGLHNLLDLKTDQLLQASGRYDAGKSSFLFQVMADNYQDHKITLIVSEEWSLNAIKERMDVLGIPRPHKNIKVIPMRPGYEDMIPSGPCIVLIDYIRADRNPFETDAQIQRILKNLKGGVAIFATQKHPGLDRPVGGQFAVHASHHIVLLDKWKELFTCKIYRTKKDRNLEGFYKTFKIDNQKRLYPIMENWRQGGIKWDHEPKTNDGNDGNDGKMNAVKRGGPYIYKEPLAKMQFLHFSIIKTYITY
ncbi:MAG: hypothetical protein C4B58_05300 [Deltaproteobacteria bacterium]|nr:MAG: hypothetical protein C4B58_05300 [Deltaproteobacteria bacterium]